MVNEIIILTTLLACFNFLGKYRSLIVIRLSLSLSFLLITYYVIKFNKKELSFKFFKIGKISDETPPCVDSSESL